MTRGKGEGSIYKRAADGMWCTSIELPRGLDGKRRRKVVCRRSKSDVLAELAKFQAGPDHASAERLPLDMLRAALRAERVGIWRGSSRRIP